MRVWISIFLMTAFLGGALPARAAEAYRREVNFEWEEVPDAKSYEVEIRKVPDDGKTKPLTFKTKAAVWTGKLVPGKYTMSLRSRDVRGVPGDWNPPSEFEVSLDPVKVKSPVEKAEIKATDPEQISQKFEWGPVPGADEYRFELSSEDGKTQVTETLKDTSYTAKLPVAQNYTFKVTAFGAGAGGAVMQSEQVTTTTFSVLGKKIAAPKIAVPETEFVREIKWQKPDYAENFDLTLNRLNVTTKRWEKVLTQENVDTDTFDFGPDQPGGMYSLIIKAKGKMRGVSETSKINFKVVSGNRSPAAEYTALVRKSIDRVSGWYAIASYLVTQITYRGETPETAALTTTTALGGTGRLGAGYFTKDDQWGFITIVDMSGFKILGANRTYSSLEMSGISRYVTGERGETRLLAGLYYKELPQLIGTPSAVTGTIPNVTFVQSSVAGPHAGAEYWYSLTPKLGFQTNAHIYYSLLTMKSPNGNNVEPRISYQLGLMGSYRVNSQFTGLMGLTHRFDQISYRANKTGAALEGTGDYDDTRITGDYLSFYAEYGF
jgi:hypothetical protein